MDIVEKAIFSFLNKRGEVFYDEFEECILKRFKKLSKKELAERMRLLEVQGKVGCSNGFWHSNFPQNYYERTMKSIHQDFNPNAKLIKCVRCKQYVETNGHHTFIDSGNFHGNVCPKCYRIIERMEALRSRKLYWRLMRSMGLDKLDDLEKSERVVQPLSEQILAVVSNG